MTKIFHIQITCSESRTLDSRKFLQVFIFLLEQLQQHSFLCWVCANSAANSGVKTTTYKRKPTHKETKTVHELITIMTLPFLCRFYNLKMCIFFGFLLFATVQILHCDLFRRSRKHWHDFLTLQILLLCPNSIDRTSCNCFIHIQPLVMCYLLDRSPLKN